MFKKNRARHLLHRAARIADHLGCASTPAVVEQEMRNEIQRLKNMADELLEERRLQLIDLDRAATVPATQHTLAAWGALPGEPLPEFPRALRRMMLECGIPVNIADEIVDPSGGDSSSGKGKGGKDKKGEGKGRTRRRSSS